MLDRRCHGNRPERASRTEILSLFARNELWPKSQEINELGGNPFQASRLAGYLVQAKL
jgi:hypothetical protein